MDGWFRHLRQGGLFLVVGIAQVALDTCVFVAITALGVPVAPANVLGRISGASLGFWLNGRYTFADGGQSRVSKQHLRRFVIAWSLLTLLSTLIMHTLASMVTLRYLWLLKPMVEGLMAMIGFVVWRQWVFR